MICVDCGWRLEYQIDGIVTWVKPCAHCIEETKKEAKDEAYNRGYEDGKLAKKSQIEHFEF